MLPCIQRIPNQHLLVSEVFVAILMLCGTDGISREREPAESQHIGAHGRRATAHSATQHRNKRRQLIRKYTDEFIPEMIGSLEISFRLWMKCWIEIESLNAKELTPTLLLQHGSILSTLLRCFRISLHQAIVGQITVSMLRLAYTVAYNHRNNSPGYLCVFAQIPRDLLLHPVSKMLAFHMEILASIGAILRHCGEQ